MKHFDPMGGIFLILGRIQKLSRSIASPIVWLYETVGMALMASGTWLRSGLRLFGAIRNTLLFQTIAGFFFGIVNYPREVLSKRSPKAKRRARSYGLFLTLASLPKELWKKPAMQRMRSSRFARSLTRGFAFTSHVSLVEPTKWLVHIAGLLTRWWSTRKWRRILRYSIPTLSIAVFAGLVWFSGNFNRFSLAQRYLELAEAEFTASEVNSGSLHSDSTTPKPQSAELGSQLSSRSLTEDQEQIVPSVATEVSEYGRLLYQRVRSLNPGDHGRFVVGSRMLANGAVTSAHSELLKIAPNDRTGDPRAHALIALIHLQEYEKSRDPEKLSLFQHHAQAGVRWSEAPMVVVLALADFKWILGDTSAAIDLLQSAARRDPFLYTSLVERASVAGMEAVALSARQRGITRLSRLATSDPNNEAARAQWALLLSYRESDLKEAEAVLMQSPKIATSRLLSRALSSVLCAKFSNLLLRERNLKAVLPILDQTMRVDPSNPSIVELIGKVVQASLESGSEPILGDGEPIESELNSILVSGTASSGIHAICAEFHLQKSAPNQAVFHLEQVAKTSPAAAYYANLLAKTYLRAGRADDALAVANKSLIRLQQKDLMNEKYVDELLSSLGDIYQMKEQSKDAIDAFELSLQVNPSSIDTRRKLVELYRKVGSDAKAADHLQALLATEHLSQQEEELNQWVLEKSGGPGKTHTSNVQ